MIFSIILEKLGINMNPDPNTDPLKLLCTSFLIFSLAILFCLFNTSLYYISIIIIKEYAERLNKYPKIKKILIYYSKLRLSYLIIEVIVGLFCCLFIIISCLSILGIIV